MLVRLLKKYKYGKRLTSLSGTLNAYETAGYRYFMFRL